jgi:uncharacterized protein YdeI (YjbR/CyaY-like superfamily)
MAELYRNMNALPMADSATWRSWLQANGQKEKGIFIIMYKKDSGIPSINIDQAIDDAICYGWIDSKINKRDDVSWYQYFAPRNPKSNWSRVNKEKVQRLAEAGLIMSPGQNLIDLAKSIGTWTALDDVENLVIPKEMQSLLDHDNKANTYWKAFSRSVKRGILEWIFNAKQQETRMARIQKTVRMAAKNKKANFDKEDD